MNCLDARSFSFSCEAYRTGARVRELQLYVDLWTHLLGAVATAISSVTSARVHESNDPLSGITFAVARRSVI